VSVDPERISWYDFDGGEERNHQGTLTSKGGGLWMVGGKTTKQTIEELERLLSQQENDMVKLRDERNGTLRRLKQAKLEQVTPYCSLFLHPS